VKLELAFSEDDAKVLYEVFGAEFGLRPLSVMKSSKGEHLLKERGFACFMKILREYLKNTKNNKN
jgi:hypothetical protein